MKSSGIYGSTNPDSPRQTIVVDLGDRSYPIAIGEGIMPILGGLIRDRFSLSRCVVISDRHVAALYLPVVRRGLRDSGISVLTIVVPPGERQKSLQRANGIISTMLKNRLDRSAAVIALGGGVIGDLAGFVAAVYQRGVNLVQIPTTLLAQVDSSVGGKVAVNHKLGKNMIGAFHQPQLVLADTAVLSTLPRREFVCGLGEVIKYGIIADAGFFGFLEEHLDGILSLDREAVLHTIARCCSLKAGVVANDEREKESSGGRAVLNFGHTVGHAIEAAAGYRGVKHGEAVLLGMLVESRMAFLLGLIEKTGYDRIVSLITRMTLPRLLPMLPDGKLLSYMAHDKKVSEEKIRFILPTTIGRVQVAGDVPKQIVMRSLDDIKKYFRYGKKRQ